VEVRNITQRIGSLSEKLDAAGTLGEPRENAFLTCDFTHNDSCATLEAALSQLGRVRTSTTFPSLCTAQLNSLAIAQLETIALLHTVSFMVQTFRFFLSFTGSVWKSTVSRAQYCTLKPMDIFLCLSIMSKFISIKLAHEVYYVLCRSTGSKHLMRYLVEVCMWSKHD
jgi:hypothetical protein